MSSECFKMKTCATVHHHSVNNFQNNMKLLDSIWILSLIPPSPCPSLGVQEVKEMKVTSVISLLNIFMGLGNLCYSGL